MVITSNVTNIIYKDQNSASLLQYVYSNNIKVSSLGNSDITLDKVIVEDTISLDNSAGSFDLRFIKAKNISTEFKTGNVEMYYINRNVTNPSDEFLVTETGSNVAVQPLSSIVQQMTNRIFNDFIMLG